MHHQIFRELTDAEIDLVNGGERVYDGGVYYIDGSWIFGGAGGGSSAGGGWNSQEPIEVSPPPQPSDTFRTSGHNDCMEYREGFNTAVTDLAYVSPLFRDMLDTIHKAGYSFDLTNSSADGHTNQTDTNRRVISWDPFLALATQDNNRNANGGELPSLVALAHEVAHAYVQVTGIAASSNDVVPAYTNSLERQIVTNYEWKIIDSLNQTFGKYGWDIDKRTNSYGSYYTTEGPESTTFSLNRPGCSK